VHKSINHAQICGHHTPYCYCHLYDNSIKSYYIWITDDDTHVTQGRVRARHETLNGQLKNWGIITQVFRHHISRHSDVFRLCPVPCGDATISKRSFGLFWWKKTRDSFFFPPPITETPHA